MQLNSGSISPTQSSLMTTASSGSRLQVTISEKLRLRGGIDTASAVPCSRRNALAVGEQLHCFAIVRVTQISHLKSVPRWT